jgi:hypothetical protein
VKAIILAATLVAVAAGPAFADGNGGTFYGYDKWQSANGNPSIPATQWNGMTPDQRQAMVHRLQQQQSEATWGHGQTGNPSSGVAQTGAGQGGGHS